MLAPNLVHFVKFENGRALLIVAKFLIMLFWILLLWESAGMLPLSITWMARINGQNSTVWTTQEVNGQDNINLEENSLVPTAEENKIDMESKCISIIKELFYSAQKL